LQPCDTAAALLFQLALRPVIERLLARCSGDAELSQVTQFSLLDDFVIVGKPEPALNMLDMLTEELETINLKVDRTKTHFIGIQKHREERGEVRNKCFHHGIPDENVEFVGSPVGDSESNARFCMGQVNSV
jgi:hypothetical protein